MPFFERDHGLIPLDNIQNWTIWSAYFYRLETILFELKDPQTLFEGHFCAKTESEKIPFFDHNHGLTPLENIQKCDYLKCKFLKARNDSFYSKDPQTLCQDDFCPKTENFKNAIFWLKSWVNPFGKYPKMRLSKVQIFKG